MEALFLLFIFSDPDCVVFSHFDDERIVYERACGLQDIPRVLARNWLQETEYGDFGWKHSLGDGFVNWVDFARWRIIYLNYLKERNVTYSKGK